MKYICKIMGEKVGEVDADNEIIALNKAIKLYGLSVDVSRK